MTETRITLKDKLQALLEVLVEDSKFDLVLKSIILKLSKNFMKNASDEDIIQAVKKMRDEMIPFILGEDENQNPER